MNIFNNLQEQYDQLWKYIIRPTRSTYPERSLGPQVFELQGKKVKRVQFQLINPRGYVIFCSHFIPLEEEKYPCVIYMHGNSSNRTQGMEYIGHLIRKNISLCTFDFSGCGNSEGEYISLGYYEQHDLNQVFEYIRHRPQVTSVAIWGRSMGAVTGLLYAKHSSHLTAAVFDSPFKSLKTLIEDMCKKNSKIPALIITGALKIIAKTIEEKAKFDIYKINPLKNQVPFLNTPAFFIVGMQDDMIPPEHTQTLFQKYQGTKKYLQKVKGNHNDSRPEECINKVIDFLVKHLIKSQKSQKQIQSPKIPIKKQVEEFDFFQDSTQIEDSSKQSETIDFFAEDSPTQNKQQSLGLQEISFHEQIKKQKPSNSENFSLTSMLSNVFSVVNITKNSQIKRGNDGYQKTIERISRQIFIDETANYRKAKSRGQSYQEKIIEEIKGCKNETFEKQIMANLDSWGF